MNEIVRWNFPSDIRFGAGAVGLVGDACKELSISRPLFVTDPGLADLGMTKDAIQCCCDLGLDVNLFTEVKGNPTERNISDGLKAYRDGSNDGVIAFGGGSALDAGKTISMLSGQFLSIWDFEDKGDNWTRVKENGIAPLVAIPTTAGTGSEVGRASSITDEKQNLKRLLFHPKMLPPKVILDPELSMNLSPALTATTGMDALSHNLEALCAPTDHPMAQSIAIEGCRIIAKFLPKAFEDGRNIRARGRMLIGSTMGAVAFQKGLGAMHALSHSLGGLFDKHHGTLNAIVMPYVLLANRPAIEMDIIYLSGYLQLKKDFNSFIDWVISLRESMNLPHTLKEIGIPEKAGPKIGRLAAVDPAAITNPIPFSAEAYQIIFENAFHGRLH